MPKHVRAARLAAGLALACFALAWVAGHARFLARAPWWHGLADQPAWVYGFVVPAAAVFMVAQTAEPGVPRWVRRLAAGPPLLWFAMLALGVGAAVDEASGVPTGALVLGLVVLLPLGGLVGIVPAGALWACCVVGLLHRFLGRALPLDRVFDAIFVSAGVLAAVVVWARLSFARPAAPPIPAGPDHPADGDAPVAERNPREEAARRDNP